MSADLGTLSGTELKSTLRAHNRRAVATDDTAVVVRVQGRLVPLKGATVEWCPKPGSKTDGYHRIILEADV